MHRVDRWSRPLGQAARHVHQSRLGRPVPEDRDKRPRSGLKTTFMGVNRARRKLPRAWGRSHRAWCSRRSCPARGSVNVRSPASTRTQPQGRARTELSYGALEGYMTAKAFVWRCGRLAASPPAPWSCRRAGERQVRSGWRERAVCTGRPRGLALCGPVHGEPGRPLHPLTSRLGCGAISPLRRALFAPVALEGRCWRARLGVRRSGASSCWSGARIQAK